MVTNGLCCAPCIRPFLLTKGDDFDAIHRLEERGIVEIVPIALLNIAATPVLYWIATASQRIWVELALLGLIVSFAWGFAVQIPAHLRLNKEGHTRKACEVGSERVGKARGRAVRSRCLCGSVVRESIGWMELVYIGPVLSHVRFRKG